MSIHQDGTNLQATRGRKAWDLFHVTDGDWSKEDGSALPDGWILEEREATWFDPSTGKPDCYGGEVSRWHSPSPEPVFTEDLAELLFAVCGPKLREAFARRLPHPPSEIDGDPTAGSKEDYIQSASERGWDPIGMAESLADTAGSLRAAQGSYFTLQEEMRRQGEDRHAADLDVLLRSLDPIMDRHEKVCSRLGLPDFANVEADMP